MQKAYREKLIRAFPRAFESEIIDFPASRRGIESKRRRLTSNKPGVWKDRRSNHWEASCGSDPISGKRIKKGGFRTEKEAIEWRDREKQKLQHRIYEARRLSDGESMECIWGIKLPEDHGLLHPGIISRCFEEYVANHPEANPTLVGEFVRWWVNEKKHTGSSEHT